MFWNRKPKFNPETYRMGWAEVKDLLRPYCEFDKILHRNQWYRVPVNPAYVMRFIESYKFEYIKVRRECEGFVDILKGKLAELGYADLLVMYVSLTLPDKNPVGRNHALAGFLQCGQLAFGEPQLGKMVRPEYLKINWIIY